MNTIILTHTDLDGIGARVVLDYLGYHYEKLLHCNYDDFESEEKYATLKDYDKIVCTDYSVSEKVLNSLLQENKIVEIYDHHESSEVLKNTQHPNFKLVHDKTKCGTTITFESLKERKRYKKIIYQYVELVDTYDLFKEESPLWEEAQDLNRVLWGSISWNEEDSYRFITDYWLNKLHKFDQWSWSRYEHEKIERAIKVENDEYVKSKVSFKVLEDSRGRKFGVTVAPKKVSIIANRLLKDYVDVDYIAIINTYDGWNKVSLRSRDANVFDCTQIANGHKCAAGMEVKEEEAKGLYAGTYKLPYKEVIDE